MPNLDDKLVAKYVTEAPSTVKGFSAKKKLKSVAWVSKGSLILQIGKKVTEVINIEKIGLTGKHNVMNALAATVAAYEAGATLTGIRQSLQKYQGMPYRQEIIAKKKGITFVNDTTSTTPDAAIAAIERFAGKGHTLHWICGGADKDLPYEDLISNVKRHASKVNVQVLDGTAFKRFTAAMKKKGIHAVPIIEFLKLPTHTETKIRGIVTATDLCCEIDNKRALREIMDPTLVHVVPETTSVRSAARMMLKHNVHHIVVMNDGQIVGMISSLDFVKIVAENDLNKVPEKVI